MKYINEKQWACFLKAYIDDIRKDGERILPSNLNKGVMFEILVEELLSSMFEQYDIIFNSTKASHDGSKDFWAIDEQNNVWWAECKNYTPNISLTQLAPTLIMAEINNVQYLIFFSYSKLNENIKRRIGQYAYEHHKEVYLCDDETLEYLLFSHKKKLLKKHLDISDTTRLEFKHSMEVQFFNEQNSQTLNRQIFHGYYEITDLQMGGIYDLNALIINRHPQETCHISLSVQSLSEDDICCFEFLLDNKKNNCSNLNFELKPNQIILAKISVKVVKYRDKLQLPQLKIDAQFVSNKLVKIGNAVSYDCIWTEKAVLIGLEYERIISTFKNSCINNNSISGFLVYGAGGTGKTRILEECCADLIRNKYKVLNFIGFDSNNSWKDVIREITFELFDISEDIGFEIICGISQIVNPYVDDPIQKKILEFFSMLAEDAYSSEELEQYYKIIYSKLRQRKYAIIIDNLQSYSPNILPFFIRMIQFFCAKQKKSSLILLFSINTSLVDIPLRRSRHSGVMDTASPEQRTAKLLVDSVSLLA